LIGRLGLTAHNCRLVYGVIDLNVILIEIQKYMRRAIMITFDMTLLFQVVNTLVLLVILIGVPFLLIRLIRNTKTNKREIELVKKEIQNLKNPE
jgi:hypothetical protein